MLVGTLPLCAWSADRLITSFHGLPWESTKADIIQIRGEPVSDHTDEILQSATWNALQDESAFGLPLKEITYHFRDECSEAHDCYLGGGSYTFAAADTQTELDLLRQLSQEYGPVEVTENHEDVLFYEGEAPTPQSILRRYIWELADWTIVSLHTISIDRSYTDLFDAHFEEGIQSITLHYDTEEAWELLSEYDELIRESEKEQRPAP